MSPELFARRCTESVGAQLHAAMTLCRRYDVRKFRPDSIYFREIQSKKKKYSNVLAIFSVRIITIAHVFLFTALTLVGTSEDV